jgi:hypothetical protein
MKFGSEEGLSYNLGGGMSIGTIIFDMRKSKYSEKIPLKITLLTENPI